MYGILLNIVGILICIKMVFRKTGNYSSNKNYRTAGREQYVENCKTGTHMGGAPTTCFAVFVADGF